MLPNNGLDEALLDGKSSQGVATFVSAKRRLVERFSGANATGGFIDPSMGVDKAIKPFRILNEDEGKISPLLKSKLATYMGNFVLKTKALMETSRDNLPTWVRNGLALIATTFSEDITDEIISTQPMSNRSAKIHYLDIISEARKGDIAQGTRLFDALKSFAGTQNYTSENVVREAVGAAGGAAFVTTLGYRPVIPKSLTLSDGVQTVTDDGNGNLIGDIAPGTNTVNYITGAVDVTFAAAATAAVVATYTYNIEAALQYPEVGIALRQETVEARPRALSMTWSAQSTFDFLADFGIDAEPTLLDAGAKVIRMEIFKHVINTLTALATGGVGIFDNASPVGVPYSLHIKTFSFIISRVQAAVWQLTRTVRPNKMVISPDIWFLVAAQDGFVGEASTANDGVAGPRKIGKLSRHGLDVYVDPTYTSATGLLTHRGPEFTTTAAVMGMYIPMYRSPIHAQGLRKDATLLSEYVIHPIDTDQIATVAAINL